MSRQDDIEAVREAIEEAEINGFTSGARAAYDALARLTATTHTTVRWKDMGIDREQHLRPGDDLTIHHTNGFTGQKEAVVTIEVGK